MNSIEYLEKVKPLLDPLITTILKEKPADPIKFMLDHLKAIKAREDQLKKSSSNKEIRTDSSDESIDDYKQQEIEKMIDSKVSQTKQVKKHRSSISAEAYGKFNVKKVFVPKVVPKSQVVKVKLKKILLQSFLFNSLEEKDLNTIIDALWEVRYKPNDLIIQQGDDGDNLYIVESGSLKCTKVLVNN